MSILSLTSMTSMVDMIIVGFYCFSESNVSNNYTYDVGIHR